jgi:hypothetical protein
VTREEWQELEQLCRKVLIESDREIGNHPIGDAIRTTGAFAASVGQNLDLQKAPPK